MHELNLSDELGASRPALSNHVARDGRRRGLRTLYADPSFVFASRARAIRDVLRAILYLYDDHLLAFQLFLASTIPDRTANPRFESRTLLQGREFSLGRNLLS